MTSDLDLLRRFARENSQDAFAEIVRRHLNLVHSAALRQVRSPQLAEDIAQSVFADLARVAATPSSPLSSRDASSPKSLTPWLYAVTRRTAIDAIRKESRRQLREQIAVEMNNMNATANDLSRQSETTADWKHIEPLLDDAMAALDETDRSAILLRYFENKSLREVGEALGATEDAAQKRVSRAVERLREFFSKRNIAIGASGLAVVISANAVQAAPVGLAAAISAAALAGSAVSTSTIIAVTKTIAMTTLQKTVITAAFVAAAGAGIFEARQAAQLREQNQLLQQQQAPLAEQIQALQHERDDATNSLAGLLAENSQLNSNPNQNELLKLRGEVGVLMRNSTTLSNQLARSSNPYGLLREQMPPVVSSGVPDTAKAYARLVKKLSQGQLSAAEELNLLRAWPYLERRFSEPDGFAYFQSEYLASMLNITNKDIVWAIRRLLESARETEHAKGLRWARLSDEEIHGYENLNLSIQKIREQWGVINQQTTKQILDLLPDDQQIKLANTTSQALDFDSHLKSNLHASLNDPRFQNLTSQEIFDAFLPPNPNVRFAPATKLERQ